MSYNQSENITSAYIDYIINNVFDEDSKALYSEISSAYGSCFFLSKENRFVEAEIQLKKGEEKQALAGVDAQPWINSFSGQQVAYFFYRTGNFDRAIYISEQVIDSSMTLVEKGFQLMFFTKIQQLLNISRIFFAKRQISTALNYNFGAIQQLLGQSSKWNPVFFINTTSFSEKKNDFEYPI